MKNNSKKMVSRGRRLLAVGPVAAAMLAIALQALIPVASVAQNPGWTVNPAAYQHSMNVTTSAYVDGVVVTGTDYTLAAFVGDVLRGVAEPTVVNGKTAFFLTVYGDESGESATFRLYDATADSIRLSGQALDFQVNGVLGSPGLPYRLDFGEVASVGDPEAWVVDPAGFGLTMTATVRVGIGDGEALLDDAAVIGAFVGAEVRGRATATTVTGGTSSSRTLFFLTIYANAEGEAITLRVASPAQDTVYVYPAVFTFATNASYGSPDAPYTVGSTVTTGEEPAAVDADGSRSGDGFAIEVFPNPAVERVTVRWRSAVGERVRVRVYDIRGRLVEDVGEVVGEGGSDEATLRVNAAGGVGGYPPGLYFVRLSEGRTVAARGFVVISG